MLSIQGICRPQKLRHVSLSEYWRRVSICHLLLHKKSQRQIDTIYKILGDRWCSFFRSFTPGLLKFSSCWLFRLSFEQFDQQLFGAQQPTSLHFPPRSKRRASVFFSGVHASTVHKNVYYLMVSRTLECQKAQGDGDSLEKSRNSFRSWY